MATVVNVNKNVKNKNNSSVFWSNTDCSSKDAHIYGLTDDGNVRPRRQKITSKPNTHLKTENKNSACRQLQQKEHPCVDESAIISKMAVPTKDQVDQKKATLKDLCSDDKQRIANLIKELAKVGSEKDIVSNEFKREKAAFVNQAKEMLASQERLLKERDEMQKHLFDCQNRLTQYQKKMELEKINHVQFQSSSQQTSVVEPVAPMIKEQQNSSLPPNDKDAESTKSERNNVLAKCSSNGTSVTYKTAQPIKFRSTPLAEPILSSTQKSILVNSAEFKINDTKSHMDGIRCEKDDYRNTSTDNQELSQFPEWKFQKSSRTKDHSYGKVGFIEFPDNDRKEVVLHSPQDPINFEFSDKNFVRYYRKLDPEQRKLELLRQRADLEKERLRLQRVLEEQTTMWQRKKDFLHRQQIVQSQRLYHFEKTGRFPRSDASNTRKVEDNENSDNNEKNSSLSSANKCSTSGLSTSTPLQSSREGTLTDDANTGFTQSFKIFASSKKDNYSDKIEEELPLNESIFASTSPILAGSPELVNRSLLLQKDDGLQVKSTSNNEGISLKPQYSEGDEGNSRSDRKVNTGVEVGCEDGLMKVKALKQVSPSVRETPRPLKPSFTEVTENSLSTKGNLSPDIPIDIIDTLLNSPDMFSRPKETDVLDECDENDIEESRILQDVFFM